MPPVPFAIQSYQSRSLPLSAQRCLNLFVEKQPQGAKTTFPLFGVPGLTLWTTVGDGPIRGMTNMKDILYVVSKDSLYQVASDGTSRLLGSGINGTAPLLMADNGYQVCITDGTSGWIYNVSTDTFGVITDADFYPAKTVTFFDDYFVFDRIGTNQFFLSALLDGTSYNGLDFASATATSANLQAITQNLQLLYLFCEDHIEMWQDTGAASFPFERYPGGVINRGTLSPQTIVKQDEAVFFLGDDGVFYRLQGNVPIRVSTHAIETAIASYADISSAFCFTHTLEGHKFIYLTFPQSLHTWVFDITTMFWHERESWDENDQTLGRWRGNCYAQAYGKHLIGDAYDGSIGLIDWSAYTEYGNTIQALAHSIPYHEDRKRIFVSKFELDVETGVGTGSGQGENPVIMLRRSIDGGRTWGQAETWKTMGIGDIGAYGTLLRWFRQGMGRQFVWEITITDPVKRVIYGAHIDADVGF